MRTGLGDRSDLIILDISISRGPVALLTWMTFWDEARDGFDNLFMSQNITALIEGKIHGFETEYSSL